MADDHIAPGGIELTSPVWDAWRPDEIAERLSGVDARWYVAGGWAIELFAGRPTRPHGDLEIGVAAGDFEAVRTALADHEFDVIGSGHRWPLDSPAFDRLHQTWARRDGVYRLDVFREPHDGDTWICRRDAALRLPYTQIIRHTSQAVPYLAPEIALLFKAKAARPKDRADLGVALPALGPVQRRWLHRQVGRLHPGHDWLALL
jgi:hypothetical protein